MSVLITKSMLKETGERILARYLEFPTKDSKRRFVIQHHHRMKSIHKDFRFEMNDHLIGYTILDQFSNPPKVETLKEAREVWKKYREKFKFGMHRQGLPVRAESKCPSKFCDEWKYRIVDFREGKIFIEEVDELSYEELARQPKVWLTIEGVFEKGEIGATKEGRGVLLIIDKGKFWEGARKPYFQEWFIYSEKKDGVFPYHKWTRVTFTWIPVEVIDPTTKKPIEGEVEFIILARIPKDQRPYCLFEGRKKGYVPPKDVIPIPPEWREKDYKKEYEEWLEWVKEMWKKYPKGRYLEEEKEEQVELAKPTFTLHLVAWKGQKVVRDLPKMKWYLRIDDKGRGKIRSFIIRQGDPRFILPLALADEGRVDRKWLTFEGELEPRTKYNPNKKLKAHMKILDRGEVKIEKIGQHYILELKGKFMKGRYHLIRREKSNLYILDRGELSETQKFKVDEHIVNKRKHWDLRIDMNDYILEFNLVKNPIETALEEEIDAIKKTCYDKTWMRDFKEYTERKVGGIWTLVKTLDSGEAKIIEHDANFISFFLLGKKIKGYFVAIRKVDGWKVMKASLPTVKMSEGDPVSGSYYKPFKVRRVPKHPEWFMLEIYDLREFTVCEPEERVKEYLPNLEIPDGVIDIGICKYQVAGTLHHVRVAYVIFEKDKWTEESARQWIKNNNLHIWDSEMIRKERKRNE